MSARKRKDEQEETIVTLLKKQIAGWQYYRCEAGSSIPIPENCRGISKGLLLIELFRSDLAG